jgi:hypothetical protein
MRAERLLSRTLSRVRGEGCALPVARRSSSLRLPIRNVPPASTVQASLQRT